MTPIEPTQNQPVVLAYESPGAQTGPRPALVYAVATVYLLVLSGIVSLPVWSYFAMGGDTESVVFVTVMVGALLLGGVSLILIPVRVVRRRPVRRRSVWFPIIGSGLLFGLLVLGAAAAMGEYLTNQVVGWHLVTAAALCWTIWSVLFAIIALPGTPHGIPMRLHRWLIAGSVLELLVAVPTHVVVRRRPDCCAGIATGFGICLGVAVMFVSFGPSVLLLFYRRRRQITRPINN